MHKELEALHKNKTQELDELPKGRKVIGCKWVYKHDGNDQVVRYHEKLMVKGYAQRKGIDFNEIFPPVFRVTTIRVVLAGDVQHLIYNLITTSCKEYFSPWKTRRGDIYALTRRL